MTSITPPLAASVFILTVGLTLFTIAPVAAQRPLRLTIGGDSSSAKGYRQGGLQLFSSPTYTTSTEGAVRLGISYDVWQPTRSNTRGLVYLELNSELFDTFYRGYGVAVRKPLSSVAGGNVYAGIGAGIYNVWLPDKTGIGLKLFTGLQSRGALFIEVGITPIAVSGYQAKPAAVLGFRL